MCSVTVVTVVFIHMMEDDQRLNTLVHEGDTVHCKNKSVGVLHTRVPYDFSSLRFINIGIL